MKGTRFVVLMLAFLLAACGGDPEAGSGPEGDPASEAPSEPEGPGPECVETDDLTASGNAWDPGCIVTSGSITITNEDPAPHNFTITGAIEEPLKGGATIEVDVTGATEPVGDTYFLCTIHPGMDGFLWVQ